MSDMTPGELNWYEAGWFEALEIFKEQWQSRPCNITLKDVIRRTNRLLKLMQAEKYKAEDSKCLSLSASGRLHLG